jgi:hypothetical protein
VSANLRALCGAWQTLIFYCAEQLCLSGYLRSAACAGDFTARVHVRLPTPVATNESTMLIPLRFKAVCFETSFLLTFG